MASRSTTEENANDQAMNRIAQKHSQEGWSVKADVSGWPQPETIVGRRPDEIATRRGSRRVIEVETDRSGDTRQHHKFRRHAGQTAITKFYGYIADKAGRRQSRFE